MERLDPSERSSSASSQGDANSMDCPSTTDGLNGDSAGDMSLLWIWRMPASRRLFQSHSPAAGTQILSEFNISSSSQQVHTVIRIVKELQIFLSLGVVC